MAIELVSEDFDAALDLLRSLGLRLDVIYPADDPHSAILTGPDGEIHLHARADVPEIPEGLPPFHPEFLLTRASDHVGRGRAGMDYRDLIPGRLGGRYIASHITIGQGGPVADWVHYHQVALQMIIVRRGWVRVVYEDQGEPFVLNPGDMVLQPPLIRHRVLESSDRLEVVEISAPALHETFAEHALDLPNAKPTKRRFGGGQHFLRHIADATPWTSWHGGLAQETAMHRATGEIADVRIVRPDGQQPVRFVPHEGELVFGFVLEGGASLDYRDGFGLGPADAFVIPPGDAFAIEPSSPDFRLLHVTTAALD